MIRVLRTFTEFLLVYLSHVWDCKLLSLLGECQYLQN